VGESLTRCLCVCCQAVITATLLQIALEFQEEGKTLEDGPKAIFFTNTTMSGVGEQVGMQGFDMQH
jgi:hypothetical protein